MTSSPDGVGDTSSIRRRLRQKWIQRPYGSIGHAAVERLLGFSLGHDGRTVTDRLNSFSIAYDLHSEIGRVLFLKGLFEEEEIRFFSHLLADIEDPAIVDIGANIGLHTLRWATDLPSSSIWAFEPSRKALRYLRQNIQDNHLASRVEVLPEALADSSANRTFYETTDDAYGSLRDTRRKPVTETYDVRTSTLDAFMQTHEIERIDLIKVDVEGLEREVLRGAAATLRRLRPGLFVEIYGGTDSNRDPTGTVEDVVALGYRPWVLVRGKAEPFAQHSDRLYNYYFEPLPE